MTRQNVCCEKGRLVYLAKGLHLVFTHMLVNVTLLISKLNDSITIYDVIIYNLETLWTNYASLLTEFPISVVLSNQSFQGEFSSSSSGVSRV